MNLKTVYKITGKRVKLFARVYGQSKKFLKLEDVELESGEELSDRYYILITDRIRATGVQTNDIISFDATIEVSPVWDETMEYDVDEYPEPEEMIPEGYNLHLTRLRNIQKEPYYPCLREVMETLNS